MTKEIKYLTLSDVHLGNNRTKTNHILQSLNIFFDNFTSKSKFKDLDIIFIAGDLFDTLLDFSSKEIDEIVLWLSRLVLFCSRFEIKLRLLEGTPSHDWKQSKIINTIYDMLEIKIDLKYIGSLSIEHIKDLDLHVLYVPDEWSSDASITFEQVKLLMEEQNLDQVDIAIMHGCFHYQIPQIKSKKNHNEWDYLGIVKYFINIGHVHVFSTYERIIAQGSFDRIAHGEERPKGATVCTIGKEPSFEFIENKNAKIYKTIRFRTNDLDESLVYLDKKIANLPNDSYVQIKTKTDHPLYIGIDRFKLEYPFFIFSRSSLKEEDEQLKTIKILELEDAYVPITITSDNIVQMLSDSVNETKNFNPQEIDFLKMTLENIRESIR